MDYDDFEIRISPAGASGSPRLSLRVECAAGEDTVEIEPEVRPEEAGELLEVLRRVSGRLGRATGAEADEPRQATGGLGRPDGGGRSMGASVEAPTGPGLSELAAVSERLSRMLFPPPVLSLWNRCRGKADAAGKGLRLRLHVNLRRRSLAWLGALPWELVLDPERGAGTQQTSAAGPDSAEGHDAVDDASSETADDSAGFLALDGRTSIVRYLDMRRDRRPFPEARPWRVLVVTPRRWDVDEPAVEHERKHLLETWGKDERFELVFPERATFDGVRRELTRQPIHALHFMGHGIFEETTGWGGLVLESESGGELPVTGPSLGNLVRGGAPALVVLNACDTARTGFAAGPGAFAGAASALMVAGVPAVVAMQLPIGQAEAAHFGKILSERLQDGLPVDRALSEARLSLEHRFTGRFAWAVPALFTRVADGRLFVVSDGPGGAGSSLGSPESPSDDVVFDTDYEGLEGSEIEETGIHVEGDRAPEAGQAGVRFGGKIRNLKNSKVQRTGKRFRTRMRS
jgi:hypothetical protein